MKRRSAIVATASLVSLAGCIFTDGEVEFERGEIDVVVDGEPVNLAADRFQSEHADPENDSIDFHLHEQDDYWYMEGPEPVTFAEGLDLLPHFAYTQHEAEHIVTIDGTDYDGSEPGTDLTFLVNDEPVDPTEYVVQDEDELRLEITTGE
ncbi:hypothetical protein [Natronorubrum sulfidifaciens]|uniref:Uncharacterized protein n=1 Tax=Natronorubrum sulfidifaciens JCM 14089 TaxID=1230460 RepID=L9W9Y6_9EURY|nr:hypothetical protein [Natronorubrum sulfidifaciens]ELY46066.1 hypothetical protein C495_07485 [Natronorubrum sulfidifaciens JCM 14089]